MSQREFREAEIYLLRFQQCLTRAMTLIKMFFVGSLKALSSDIYRRVADRASTLLLPFFTLLTSSSGNFHNSTHASPLFQIHYNIIPGRTSPRRA